MDHRDAITGECTDDAGEFDVGRLAERLLLFERVTLRSVRLAEVPALARAFGSEGLRRLLDSGALALDPTVHSFGNRNQRDPFSYEVISLRGSDDRVQDHLKSALDQIDGLRQMERVKLTNAIERHIVRAAPDLGHAALKAFSQAVAGNSPSFHVGALLAASEIVGMKIRPADLELRVHADGSKCTVESNLMQIGLDEDRAHKVIQGALLAVAGTEQKIEQMRAHKSMCVFREAEVLVLQEKIGLAWSQLLPDAQEKRLSRVLTLNGFPDFSAAVAAKTLDFGRLLEARDSPECVLFRNWLRATDTVPDEELVAKMGAIRSKLGAMARGVPGKILRLATTTGAGLIPFVGPVTGFAASALDSFLVEKVLPYSGPVAFLDNAVRSILGK